MPTYEYTALDATGREQRGTLEADTPRQVRAQLRDREAAVDLKWSGGRAGRG